MKQRNFSVDIMKGIAILLMMYEHLAVSPNPVAISFIYSFHMPLFFILAGAFMNCEAKSIIEIAISSTKRLLTPLLTSMIIIAAIIFAQIYPEVSLTKLIHFGPMWFLLALFLARIVFCVIIKSCGRLRYSIIITGVICFAISLGAVYAGTENPVPYTPRLGLSALFFLYIGWLYKKIHIPKWAIFVCIAIWILSLFFGAINMRGLHYTNYLLSISGACSATFVMYKFCQGLTAGQKLLDSNIYNRSIHFLAWAGKYSLVILCMHSIELTLNIDYHVGAVCTFIIRVILALLLAFVASNTPILKVIYK